MLFDKHGNAFKNRQEAVLAYLKASNEILEKGGAVTNSVAVTLPGAGLITGAVGRLDQEKLREAYYKKGNQKKCS